MMVAGRIVSRFPGGASSGRSGPLSIEVYHGQRFNSHRAAAPHPQR